MSNGESSTGLDVIPGRFDRSPTLGQIAKAKAQAQVKFLPLGKDKTADIATRTGGKYSYAYADLATCLDAVIPALSEVGIALFQPVQVEAARAIATTLLVHESNEYISGDFSVAIVDPTDARSVGSAATYARRYGLLSMLGYASSDEDDDGQEARGGDHEQKAAASSPACPACGVVGSIMKGAAQYGGGILCWAKRGGCGVKWPEGTPFPPTAPPPLDPDSPLRSRKVSPPPPVVDPVPPPARKPRASKQSGAAAGKTSGRVDDPGAPAAAESDPICPNVRLKDGVRCSGPARHEPPCLYVVAGSEDCPTSGCWGGLNHEGDHTFDPDGGRGSEQSGATDSVSAAAEGRGADVPVSAAAAETPASTAVPPTSGPVTFMIGGQVRETAGMTEEQFRASILLGTQLDKDPRYMNKAKWPKGYSRELLRRMLGLADVEQATRKMLTAPMAEKYLAIQRAAAEAGSPQAEMPK